MTNRERTLAVFNYQSYDRLPIAHFGYWDETLRKWADEGHITPEMAENWGDGNTADVELGRQLGFDMNYYTVFHLNVDILPTFESRVLEVLPDGARKVLDPYGVIILQKDDVTSIPSELGHTLTDRASWEEHFLPRLNFSRARIDPQPVLMNRQMVPFAEGGREYLQRNERDHLYGLHCGSLFGSIRNWWGVEGISYLYADDEQLFDEVIDTVGELSYLCAKTALESGAKFDFAHFWEDICFKNGPLINPEVFHEKVGPHYRRVTDLVHSYGIEIVSLDCDGWIDKLIPTWIENGVNTMFPMEVGTWNASIAPWRARYGRELRGVGGMNKVIFSRDRAAVDAEIERLKPLVDLGGYLPCPDHRIAPDAEWDNVRYYCDRMREVFDAGRYGTSG